MPGSSQTGCSPSSNPLGGSRADGWAPGNGQVVSASPNASFNAVPLLVILHRITGQAKYLEAARPGPADFCWANGQCRGCFVGRHDRQSGHHRQRGRHALGRGIPGTVRSRRRREHGSITPRLRLTSRKPGSTAGMSPCRRMKAAPSRLRWKRRVPTVGLQLIATGHSLVDAYMAFNARRIRQALSVHGGPALSRGCPQLLLHNTKRHLGNAGEIIRSRDMRLRSKEHWSLTPTARLRHYTAAGCPGWPQVILTGSSASWNSVHGLKEQLLNPSLEVHHDP